MNQSEPEEVKGRHSILIPGGRRLTKSPCRRLLGSVLAACLAISLVTACSAPPELDAGVAGKLQGRVAAAKQLAAQQNFPAALAELEQLGRDVTSAAEQRQVSQQRKARIEAAISTIKDDLEAAMTPPPQPLPTTPASDPSDTKNQNDQEEDAKKEAEKRQEEAKKDAEKKKKDQDKGDG